VDGAEAHRTRFSGRIYLASRKIERTQFLRRPADGVDFGMTGCVARKHGVAGNRKDLPPLTMQAPNGPPSPRREIFQRLSNSQPHKTIILPTAALRFRRLASYPVIYRFWYGIGAIAQNHTQNIRFRSTQRSQHCAHNLFADLPFIHHQDDTVTMNTQRKDLFVNKSG